MAYAAAPSALCGYGMNFWIPSFLIRVHEVTQAQVSLPFGLALGIGGGLGAMAGGALTARAARRDLRAFLTLPAYTMVIFAHALLVAVWTDSLTVSYLALFTQFYLMGPFFAIVQRLAPLRGRAVSTAFFFFILSLVGLGIGPAYVGAMNDMFAWFFGDAEGLRYALMTLPAISLIAGGIAWFGRNAILKDTDVLGGAARA
jgi:hypothetical protein